LEGIVVVKPYLEPLSIHVDDRGSVYCALDNIGSKKIINVHRPNNIKRTYIVQNWKAGTIRAWHGHMKGWTGLHVFKGAAKIVSRDITESTLPGLIKHEFILSDRNLGIVWVPPGWYNGSMSLEDDTRILVYSTLSFAEVKNDDIRATAYEQHVDWQIKNR